LDEQVNQTITQALSKYINHDQDDWHQLLDPILFAYRTKFQSSRLPTDVKPDTGNHDDPVETVDQELTS